MTALYIVTFGSFIGFSMALPLSITVIFGISHVPDANGVMQHTLKNPNAPSAFTYAWIGPFVGAAVRPARRLDLRQGRRLHRHPGHLGGDGAGLGGGGLRDDAGLRLGHAGAVLPGLPGPVHAAVLRQRHRQRLDLPHHRRDLRPQQAGPVLGWTSAIAAYGAFIAPGGDRRPDQGRHAAVRDVRLRRSSTPCAWC
jgi:NNP family nitrate/nitrite transporter-like MFS transporter